MTARVHLQVTAALLMVMSLAPSRAADTAASPDTARILEAIDQNAAARTAHDRQAARELNLQGDRAYRQRHYRAAFTAYSASYPNYPTPHAYILAGDAHWREVVHHLQMQASEPTQACPLDNSHFAHDLAVDVAQHHEVGLALAEREHHARASEPPLYRRARTSAACLQGLAKQYESQPASTCVDLAALRQCLGAPLIR